MKDREQTLRDVVVQGWTMMFLVFLAMFIADLTKSAIVQDFGKWHQDPGHGGLTVLLVVMGIYTFMPMLARTVAARWFRWTVVGITAFFTLFFVAHQLAHMLAGDKPFGMLHVLDFSHHLLGIWVTGAAVAWARTLPAEAPAPVLVPNDWSTQQ